MHRYGLQSVDETAGPRASGRVGSNLTDLWASQEVWEVYRADLRERFTQKAFVARPTPLPLELYYDCYVGRTARTFLESLPTGESWFCWVSFGGPHEPWDAPEPYASLYAPKDMPQPRARTRHVNSAPGLLQRLYGSGKNSPDFTPEDVAAMRANYAGNVTLETAEDSFDNVPRNEGILPSTWSSMKRR